MLLLSEIRRKTALGPSERKNSLRLVGPGPWAERQTWIYLYVGPNRVQEGDDKNRERVRDAGSRWARKARLIKNETSFQGDNHWAKHETAGFDLIGIRTLAAYNVEELRSLKLGFKWASADIRREQELILVVLTSTVAAYVPRRHNTTLRLDEGFRQGERHPQ